MSKHNQLYTEALGEIGQWVYKEPFKNKKGSYTVYVQPPDGSRRRIRLQMATDEQVKAGDLPRAPFGISQPYGADRDTATGPIVSEGPADYRRTLDLTIENDSLKEFFQTIDMENMKRAVDNSQSWFQKKTPLKQTLVEAKYKSIVKTNDDEEAYKPIFRTKVTIRGNDMVKVYVVTERDGKPVYTVGTLDDVTPNIRVLPIVEVIGVWFTALGFGMTLLATDLLLYPVPKRPAFDFILSEPIEKDDMDIDEDDDLCGPEPEDDEDVKEVQLPGAPASPSSFFP